MTKPKIYAVRRGCTAEQLIKAGFVEVGDGYKSNRILYKFDDTKQPFIMLFIKMTNNNGGFDMNVAVKDDNGNIYAPFYNPALRHHNMVYEKTVTEYHRIMDGLVQQKIIKHHRQNFF